MFGSPKTTNIPERDEPKHITPADINPAKDLLNWEPKMKLEKWIKTQIQ